MGFCRPPMKLHWIILLFNSIFTLVVYEIRYMERFEYVNPGLQSSLFQFTISKVCNNRIQIPTAMWQLAVSQPPESSHTFWKLNFPPAGLGCTIVIVPLSPKLTVGINRLYTQLKGNLIQCFNRARETRSVRKKKY